MPALLNQMLTLDLGLPRGQALRQNGLIPGTLSRDEWSTGGAPKTRNLLRQV